MKFWQALKYFEKGKKIVRKDDLGYKPPMDKSTTHELLYREDFLANDWIVIKLLPESQWSKNKGPYKIIKE